MATGMGSGNKAQSTGAPAGRAPEGMLALGLIAVLVIGGFAAFAWLASVG
jgi:hypothetical protein